jgi:hypothetical protein
MGTMQRTKWDARRDNSWAYTWRLDRIKAGRHKCRFLLDNNWALKWGQKQRQAPGQQRTFSTGCNN